MKRSALLFMIVFSLAAGKLTGQCVNAGGAMAAICQGGTSASLGGSFNPPASSAVWDDGTAGGSFSNNSGSTPGTATYTASATFTGIVTLTLTAHGGSCDGTAVTKTITVNALPVANNQTPEVCEDTRGSGTATGVDLTLQNTAITGGSSDRSVVWYNDAGRTTPVASPTNVTLTGTKTYYPRVTNTITSCYNDATVTYTVSPMPVATSVQVTGPLAQGATLTASYIYPMGGCNPEVLSKTEISWYVADNGSGLNSTWVATKTGTDKTYQLTAADITKYIRVCVSVSDGSVPIAPAVCSSVWIGPVTANTAPVATGVSATGLAKVRNILTGVYSYSDAENDPQGTSLFQWFKGDDAAGSNPVFISGATSLTFQLTNDEVGKYIGFKVRPIAVSGSLVGSWTTAAVWVGPVTNDAPVASGVTISGTSRVAGILTGNYIYSDTEGDVEGVSTYQWYTGTSSGGAGPVPITGATSRFYQLTNNEFGKYIGFSVTPVAQSGTTTGVKVTTITWVGPVTNPPPVASNPVITGTKNAGEALTGQYIYSDAEGDIENGSVYEWSSSSSPGGTYTVIPGETALTHVIQLWEQGLYFKFSVTPKTLTGSTTGLKTTTPAGFGPANRKPVASSVDITGSPVKVGTTLKAVFNYFDADGDAKGATQFRWFRDSTVQQSGTDSTYLLTTADGGATMGVEVTPVSSTGYPDTGDPVTFTMSLTVDDPTTIPVASGVCIDGRRAVGAVLTGRYTYTYSPKAEGNSKYKWYRNNVEIPGATSKYYTMIPEDLNSEIKFEVTPRSSNNTPKEGNPVQSKPLARITMTKTQFIATDKDTILTAVPAGGYFWGRGVVENTFSPRSVNYMVNPDTVTYHLTDYTCTQDAVTYITVGGVTAYFEGFNSFYCQNGKNDTIVVRKVPSFYYFKDFSISRPEALVAKLNDSTIVIDPAKLTPGVSGFDWLTFTARDLLFTSYLEVKNTFDVEAIMDITITGVDSGDVFCHNDPVQELFVNQPDGEYAGPVVNGFLDPSLATGPAIVSYTYKSPRGCKSSQSIPIQINPIPVVSFVPADSCIRNSTSLIQMVNRTTCTDSVSKWRWSFYDQGIIKPDSVKNPVYNFKTGGFYRVTLAATTINNCTATGDQTIEMGFKPVADFRWTNDCYNSGSLLYLFDSTFAPTRIISRTWNFFDGDSIHIGKNTTYPHKGSGFLDIRYIVNTKFRGCSDTIRRSVYIRPTVSLAKDYSQDFEGGTGGWIKNYDTLNTWSFGKPERPVINSAPPGLTNAWFTNFDTLTRNPEQSSIVSPCFNFDSITRPMISMKMWTRFNKNRDGAALQYRIRDSKIGDREDWQYVGSLDDGINWYNSSLIQGRPGGDQVGWTTGTQLDNGWAEVRHSLDNLVGKTGVKFRVVYGSNGTSQDNDGLAFGDIWIGKRSRGVLLEHFTNNSSSDASNATEMVSDLSNRWSEDIINIQYHTNFPGANDPYYLTNPEDVSARVLFYGLSRAPYSFIDGGSDKENFARLYDWAIASLDSNDISRRSLINPYFNIHLNASVSTGVLSVNGSITALRDVNASNITLYLVVTEKKSNGPAGASGETKYYNVFRKFIPDAAGNAIKRIWAADATDTIPEKSWIITNMPAGASIEVVAILQNNITKDVYQAESVVVNNITVGIDDQYAGEGKGFILYPNPAASKLTITFENPIKEVTDIKIYDFSGTLVKSWKTGTGESEYVIDDLSLKSGIYLLRISSGGIEKGFRKLIVTQR